MILRNDYEYGALPLMVEDPEVYDKCRCDGQFAENDLCRVGHLCSFIDNRQYGLCLGSRINPFALIYDEHSLRWNDGMCPRDGRPIFIMLGGGSHHSSDAKATINGVIRPIMEEVKQAATACPHVKLHVAWIGLGAQSRSLDELYPHQRREKVAAFNEAVSAFWSAEYDAPHLDVWNLTRNAPSSDYYHYLSDVNALKAMYLMNLLDSLVPDGSMATS